jgi:hypothetical protein
MGANRTMARTPKAKRDGISSRHAVPATGGLAGLDIYEGTRPRGDWQNETRTGSLSPRIV